MLVPYTENYKLELTNLFMSVFGNPKYKYWFSGYPYVPRFVTSPPTDWCFGRSYVSISRDGSIIGTISYDTDRTGTIGYNLGIINFRDDPSSKYTFAFDLKSAINEFFDNYGGESFRFKAATDNPAAIHYENIIRRAGGNIVGILRHSMMTWDGKPHDEIFFQIIKEDYWDYFAKCRRNEPVK